MLSAIAIVPSPPVMVPELASSAAAETEDLRAAAVSAAAQLPPRWISVGVAATDGRYGPDSVGTFAGYGVDVRVALSGPGTGEPTAMPLCALITAWLRGLACPQAVAEVRTVRGDRDPDAAAGLGRQLRAELDAGPEQVGVLVVADGANTLSAAAPGGHDPDSAQAQAALDDALAGGDTAALMHLPAMILGRAAYQVLAGLTEPGPRSAKELYRGAPYGVGYSVGVWTP